MRNIQAVTVVYNTPELIQSAIKTIKRFYNSLEIIIVDGSEKNSICFKAVEKLKTKYKNIKIVRPGFNIGHGRGLQLGISKTTAKNILIFDSDIEMKKPCIELMLLELIKKNTYGVGQIVEVDQYGKNTDNGIKYLHPHFCLLSREMYHKIPGFIHHGAPFIETMKYLSTRKTIKIRDFNVPDYILHKERGTRNVIITLGREKRVKPLTIQMREN